MSMSKSALDPGGGWMRRLTADRSDQADLPHVGMVVLDHAADGVVLPRDRVLESLGELKVRLQL